MPHDKKKDVYDDNLEPSILADIWRSLSTVRTTIWVLPILAIASTVGAIVAQGKPASFYTMTYGETLGRIVTAFSFDDLYSSTWYLILIGILCFGFAGFGLVFRFGFGDVFNFLEKRVGL